MLANMTAEEFVEWQICYRIDPWGEERADWRQAQTSAILANTNRPKGLAPFSVDAFMLDTRTPAEKTAAHVRGLEATRLRDDLVRRATAYASKRTAEK